MTKCGEAGGEGTPKIQITSEDVPMPSSPKEGDEWHNTSVNAWFVYRDGMWQYKEWE